MKKNINKNLKKILIGIISILICVTSFFLYKGIKYPGVKEEKVSLYSYNNGANINYKVFLKPNILYDTQSVGKDNIYIKEFIDYVKTSFNYQFNGEREAEFNGDYEIIAEIEGYTGERETYVSIWKKEFQVIPKTKIEGKEKTISINEEISLNLDTYNDFAKKVIEDSKINVQVKLTVFMKVKMEAKTENGLIEEELSPSIIIPLNSNYFEITGNTKEENQGDIEETKEVELKVNKNIIIIYSFSIGILLIILILLVFFTKGITRTNSSEKKLKKIFKDHGDRLIALSSEAVFTFKNRNEVKSIEDLVRIADEIGKPIMYKYSSDFKEISRFYILDENQVYVFNFTDKSVEPKNEELNKEEIQSAESDDCMENIESKTTSDTLLEEELQSEDQILMQDDFTMLNSNEDSSKAIDAES